MDFILALGIVALVWYTIQAVICMMAIRGVDQERRLEILDELVEERLLRPMIVNRFRIWVEWHPVIE